MKLNKFNVRWPFTLMMLVLVGLFLKLGFWQLHRADEKRQLQKTYQQRLTAKPIDLIKLDENNLEALRYYPVKLTGIYDNRHTILLDNKMYQHQIGYQVLTPFLPIGSRRAILINRGWIARGADRQHLPQIPFIKGSQTIEGHIYLLEKQFALTHAQETSLTWPLRVQIVEINKLERILNKPLYPFIILLSPNQPNGFIRDWQPVNMPAYKHVGYAVQWFALAGLLVIIYIVLGFRSKKTTRISK